MRSLPIRYTFCVNGPFWTWRASVRTRTGRRAGPASAGRRRIAGPVRRAAAQVVRQPHLRAGERLAPPVAPTAGLTRAGRDDLRYVRPRRRRRDDARARVAAVGVRVDERARGRIGVDRGDDLRRRAGRARRSASVARLTTMSLTGTVISLMPLLASAVVLVVVAPRAVGHRDRQRRVRHARVLELGGDVVAAQVAHGLREQLDRERRVGPVRVARSGRSCPPSSPCPDAGSRPSCSAASMACTMSGNCAVSWSIRRVGLGRVHVLRDEVLLEAGHARRHALAGPLDHGCSCRRWRPGRPRQRREP